jgi:hypothetical protein
MAQIKLMIARSIHAPSAAIGCPLTAIRLMAGVSLRHASGWTRYVRGVVDTGAAVSLFPAHVWRTAAVQVLGSVRVGGIVARDECRTPARLAVAECLLTDGLASTGPVRVHAYLADSNQVPSLIGVSGLIERGVLHSDVSTENAYLQMPA